MKFYERFQARFGTVNEYFQLMHSALNDEQEKLPILSGDFFTYADRNDHYWSGIGFKTVFDFCKNFLLIFLFIFILLFFFKM